VKENDLDEVDAIEQESDSKDRVNHIENSYF